MYFIFNRINHVIKLFRVIRLTALGVYLMRGFDCSVFGPLFHDSVILHGLLNGVFLLDVFCVGDKNNLLRKNIFF